MAEERTTCLNTMNFFQDWESWRKDLAEMVSSAKESGKSDEEIRKMVGDTLDFLSERLCQDSQEERIIGSVWDRATPEERKMVADLILRAVGY